MQALTGVHDVPVQLITATHSPLVLASIEPHFAEPQDAVFLFELNAKAEVELKRQHWAKQGDVLGWLVSDTFGLLQARSVEAEQAIEAAEAWMRNDRDLLPEALDSKDKLNAELERVLAGHDPFWPRWVVWAERQERNR